MIKILAIGNSFSMNTTQYFNEISYLLNGNSFITNLYIPGCSLKTHYENIDSQTLYEIQIDALRCGTCSLTEALNETNYDIITLQQASDYSGMIESLYPYLDKLIETIHSNQTKAKIFCHQTWSYDFDSKHPAFVNYSNDSNKMYDSIHKTTRYINNHYHLPLIKTGMAMDRYRSNTKSNTITKDGYHLKDGLIRILASLVWFHTLVRELSLEDIISVVKHYNYSESLAYEIEKIISCL